MALDEDFLKDLLDFLFLQVRSRILFLTTVVYISRIYISAQRPLRYAFQYRRARRGGISV